MGLLVLGCWLCRVYTHGMLEEGAIMNIQSDRQKGFSHHFILPLIVVVLIGGIGVYTMMQSRAASMRLCRNKTYSIGSKSTVCLTYAKTMLNAIPSTGKAIDVTQSYSADTVAKVRAFQASKKLATHDALGPKTWTQLCAQKYTGEALLARKQACEKDGASLVTTAAVTVATWNVLKYDNSVTHMREGIKDIFSAGASVISLEEVSAPSFTKNSPKTAVDKIKTMDIGVYSPGEGAALVWDNTKVQKVSAGSFLPVAGRERRFVYAEFQYVATGHTFYVIGVHMQPGVNDASEKCTGSNCKYYKAQMKALVSKVKKLQSFNVPIFIAGDFNVDYKNKHNCDVSWWPCRQLQQVGIKSSIATLGFSSVKGTTTKYLDQVYYWTDSETRVTPVSNTILGSQAVCVKSKIKDMDGDTVKHCWNGSDHRPLLFKVEFGG